MDRPHVLIVGAGLAGGTAAAALREDGFAGTITLVGAEDRPPYNRPPLSKEYLRGEARFEDQLVHPQAYYAEQSIDLVLGRRVVAVDAGRKTVDLDDGRRLSYDRLLVTTGGRNRAISTPGADLEGIFPLRTVEESDRIREVAAGRGRAVIAGLGFIGSEVAASLRQLGVEVVAIDPNPAPLSRVLGPEVGGILADIHREHGVQLCLDDSVAAFEGIGRVARVRTRKGRVLDCDWVVTGMGIVPNSEVLAAAGAAVDNGILVDAFCRTSLPDVYAAGDVANHLHPTFGRVRVEHWNNAFQQGRAAARALLGRGAAYDYVHTFWSNQYQHTVEYVGFAARWDRLVVRGRLDSRAFLAFYLQDGIVRAAMGLDRGGDPEDPAGTGELKTAVRLVRQKVPVDAELLADESVDLSRLAPEPAST
jgi:3-phenylpropionate/trans-cinnamate dioxygenase ferredoxin reductase subunit